VGEHYLDTVGVRGSIPRVPTTRPSISAGRSPPGIVDPGERKVVSLDPRRAFGRPTIADRSLIIEVIADRFKGGDSIDLLAKDYRLSKDQVEVALRWGLHGAAAA
jgi:uncharacterized protein (DUF433 family)